MPKETLASLKTEIFELQKQNSRLDDYNTDLLERNKKLNSLLNVYAAKDKFMTEAWANEVTEDDWRWPIKWQNFGRH